MGCGCGESLRDHTYISKQIKVNGNWYTVFTENAIDGTLGVLNDGKVMWVKPSRIEAVRG